MHKYYNSIRTSSWSSSSSWLALMATALPVLLRSSTRRKRSTLKSWTSATPSWKASREYFIVFRIFGFTGLLRQGREEVPPSIGLFSVRTCRIWYHTNITYKNSNIGIVKKLHLYRGIWIEDLPFQAKERALVLEAARMFRASCWRFRDLCYRLLATSSPHNSPAIFLPSP